jgi:ABC-type transport system involved in multi-copper enzyme maturation permease subunit
MSLVKSVMQWFRQTTDSWTTWQERLVALFFLLLAAVLVYLSTTHFVFWQSAIAWAVFGIALAVCARQDWVKLFGPVLFYDMLRTARRSRYSIIRILYAGMLFFILAYMFLILALSTRLNPNDQINRRGIAVLAEMFFATFMIVQLVIVVILTPAYVAGAIAEEKDRKTIEFLLATDLHNREIVLSKLLSRLANMTLLLLTGLPILSILQLLGGVDSELMLSGFAAVGLTMLGIASVSILLSTLFKKPRDSISLTYLLLIAYAALACFTLALRGANFMTTPIWFGESPPTLNDAADVLNAGNPIIGLADITFAIGGMGRLGAGRTSLAAVLPGIIRRYAWFHLTLSTICIIWSIIRIRAIALKQTTAGTTVELRWWQRVRPSVGNFPMIWKEFFIEGGMKANWLVWLAVIVLVLLTLGTGLWVLGHHLWEIFSGNVPRWRGFNPWHSLSESMNIWFRITGTGVALLMLMVLGVRASTCITTERERDTFDALITTPMSAESILIAKLLGNLMSVRLGWLWLGSMLLLAVCTGAVHPVLVPLLIIAWFVYALVCTMIGMAFSMLCKSSLYSSVLTVLTTLVLGGGHWIITYCCGGSLFLVLILGAQRFGGRDLSRPLEDIAKYGAEFLAGLTPPFVFAFSSFSWHQFHNDLNRRELAELFAFCLLGLVLWTMVCVLVWFAILVPTFRRIARREELEYH